MSKHLQNPFFDRQYLLRSAVLRGNVEIDEDWIFTDTTPTFTRVFTDVDWLLQPQKGGLPTSTIFEIVRDHGCRYVSQLCEKFNGMEFIMPAWLNWATHDEYNPGVMCPICERGGEYGIGKPVSGAVFFINVDLFMVHWNFKHAQHMRVYDLICVGLYYDRNKVLLTESLVSVSVLFLYCLCSVFSRLLLQYVYCFLTVFYRSNYKKETSQGGQIRGEKRSCTCDL
jgi:hypothetical protein